MGSRLAPPGPVRLVPIEVDGTVDLGDVTPPPFIADNCALMPGFYRAVGYQPPWIGYVSVAGGRPVGGGAFKGAPRDNRVEIAYYTVPELEGQGFGSATAKALVAMARTADPGLVIAAQTLPERNASTALLEKLGFRHHGAIQHPEDGEVWEWRL